LNNQTNGENRHPKSCIREGFELAGIVFGIIGVIAIVAQYIEMVKATQATLKAVQVSQGQMEVMKRQLDDSEAQQRAWLKIEQFQVKRITNSEHIPFGKYGVEINMLIKNYGSTPAIDLGGSGMMIGDFIDKFNKRFGITNGFHKWTSGSPTPEPRTGSVSIMPQETYTNTFQSFAWDMGENVYMENWLSYRDVFGHPWGIGEVGHYDFTNDCWVSEHFFWDQYHQADQTNK
jgi:hypothetical protein